MKLLRLQVDKLYGHYSYDIIFNPDVTFIYGLNGCGKTTVLNITEAIITGQIFKLFYYNFHRIILEYAPKDNISRIHKIIITKDGNKDVYVNFKNNDYHILNDFVGIKGERMQSANLNMAGFYFCKYWFLTEIKEIFNHICFPLNRPSAVYDVEDGEGLHVCHSTGELCVNNGLDEQVVKFLDIVNGFINLGEDDKKVGVDSMGQVYFTTRYSKNKISIQHLSSGEKQLITFFANLIFKVKSDTSGIFVVDEPELSLHLSWQKIFIEKTLEINKNIQLIFATHAPEIIGKNRDKMFRLEKKCVD